MVVRLTEDCKGVADIAVAEIITPLAPPLRDTCPSRALQSPIELSDGANGVRLSTGTPLNKQMNSSF